MNRFLLWFNLAGVCVLAACCAAQWQSNRRLNLGRIELEQARMEEAKTLGERDKTIMGNMEDMNDFRDRLARSDNALEEARGLAKADEGKLAQIGAQRDALQGDTTALNRNLEEWKAAVAARDAALKQSDETAAKLATDRNDAVAKFNELASRYNAAEDQLKQAAEAMKKLAADRNDAVARFNELAEKYNGLVKTTATQP